MKNNRANYKKHLGREVQCAACGTCFKLQHYDDAIRCPYCQNAPDEVSWVRAMIWLDAEEMVRWM